MGAPTRGQRHDSARASVTGKAMTAARPAPTAPPGSFAWALGGALAALIALRFLAELRTDARFWGLDYARFLAPGLRFGPWVAALIAVLLASIPSVRSGVARGVGRIGGGHVLAALICGALCLACPDLILFTGDFALRRSAIAGLTRFDRLFPQATQLDRLVHLVVPQALRSWTGLSVETVASATGVIEAMIFGALSVEFARRCGARGVTVADGRLRRGGERGDRSLHRLRQVARRDGHRHAGIRGRGARRDRTRPRRMGERAARGARARVFIAPDWRCCRRGSPCGSCCGAARPCRVHAAGRGRGSFPALCCSR
jgi:hypothetical protein